MKNEAPLQNLSNLCEFGYKEPYMADMNKLIIDNMDRMKQYIDTISVSKNSYTKKSKKKKILISILKALPDTPRREESETIQYGIEMATIHRHLLNNIKELRENNSDVSCILK